MSGEKDKIRVGVLRGGAGKHYHASLQKGGEIISYIFENLPHRYKPVDILVDQAGVWHMNGLPVLPAKLLYKVDVVWNTAHQGFSNILESFSIPNIGVPPFSLFFAENGRELLEKHIRKIGVGIPKSLLLPAYQEDFDGPRELYAMKKAKEIFKKFPSPWIVKSLTPDSSMGIHLVKTFPELVGAIEDGVSHQQSVLVEEFIAGKVASLHSVPGFRMGDLPAQAGEIYTFPLGNTFGNFSASEKDKLVTWAKKLHQHVGAKHYLKTDLVLGKRGRVYLLRIELMPDLHTDSHFHQVCESVGAKTHHVVEHILEQALH